MKKHIKKYKKMRIGILALVFLFLLSCNLTNMLGQQQVEPTITDGPTVVEKATKSSTTEITPGNPLVTPTSDEENGLGRTKYQFDVIFDYDGHFLKIQEIIDYTNETGVEITRLPFLVPPLTSASVLKLIDIRILSDSQFESYEIEGLTLWLNFGVPVGVSERIQTQIDYSLQLTRTPGVLGYGELQANISDWYPFIPPYDQTTGWIINNPGQVGEYLVKEKADHVVNIQLVGSTPAIIAAPGDFSQISVGYSYVLENSRDFSWSASPFYQTISEEIGDSMVKGYFFQEDIIGAREVLKNTVYALPYFSQLFGVPYQHKTMLFVEADFADGMEYDGMYFLSKDYFKSYDGTHINYLSMLAVHETAHQWWYGIVGNDQARDPWLDESLCTFSELLFYEFVYPGDVDGWWAYRVNAYNPSGKVDISIYDQPDLRLYINSVYLQGAKLLSDLRNQIGGEAFINSLRNYAIENQHQIAHPDDFFSVFSKYDISNIKEQYFFR